MYVCVNVIVCVHKCECMCVWVLIYFYTYLYFYTCYTLNILWAINWVGLLVIFRVGL